MSQRPALQVASAAHSTLIGIARAGNRIVAVGERGIIVLSDDSAATWHQAKVPVSVSLVAVSFGTATQGWAVGHGGVILHSSDAGETWSQQLDGAQAARLIYNDARSRVDRGDGDQDELKAGLDAAQALLKDGPDKPFLDVWAESGHIATVVGSYNLILRTQDGGRSWTPLESRLHNPQGLHLYSIRTRESETYIAGEAGSFFRLSDTERRFELEKTPYGGTYFGLVPTTAGPLILFGLQGRAYRSDDQGSTWHPLETHVANTLVAGLELANGSVALVSQAGEVLISEDRGHSFELMRGTPQIPTAGMVQAPDGRLVLIGVGGARRLSLASAPAGDPGR